jgi:hypothetical protein
MSLLPEQVAELEFLRLTSEFGKFAVSVGARLTSDQQGALERLQVRRWITLIDVTPLPIEPGLFRVFLLEEPARAWLRLYDPDRRLH